MGSASEKGLEEENRRLLEENKWLREENWRLGEENKRIRVSYGGAVDSSKEAEPGELGDAEGRGDVRGMGDTAGRGDTAEKVDATGKGESSSGSITQHSAKRSKIDKPVSPIKILQLKDNPVRRYQWKNEKMIRVLRRENEDLLTKKETVDSTIERLRLELADQREENSNSEKRMLRLKERYSKNIGKFVDVVYKLLGYKIEFVTETRLKIIPKLSKNSYIVLDIGDIKEMRMKKENFKMEVGGKDLVENLIQFWVIERREISCFFNALGLEMYERAAQ
ncbi:DEKNAAC105117 [Brettanomyces naardenensis]|uniref:Spindle assembly checkpoint component MAD1 n=1 Tax=Brettanomyces naardenensis TaxID=13370 RepID=A0A448YSU4_BRENA|nr:DEKNAAC105117 [Brettanomyces naardenensis]